MQTAFKKYEDNLQQAKLISDTELQDLDTAIEMNLT